MEERILTAPDGYIYVSVIDRNVFGKTIYLGSIDTADNWELVLIEDIDE